MNSKFIALPTKEEVQKIVDAMLAKEEAEQAVLLKERTDRWARIRKAFANALITLTSTKLSRGEFEQGYDEGDAVYLISFKMLVPTDPEILDVLALDSSRKDAARELVSGTHWSSLSFGLSESTERRDHESNIFVEFLQEQGLVTVDSKLYDFYTKLS